MMRAADSVGVTFVNGLLGRGLMNGVVNLQFGTYQFTPTDKAIDPDLAVSCRLRMDVECAKQLHEALGALLEPFLQGSVLTADSASTSETPN